MAKYRLNYPDGPAVENAINKGEQSHTEVTNAKVGVDGTNYSTLENRLNTEFSELREELSDLSERAVANVHLYSDGGGIVRYEDKDDFDDYLTYNQIKALIEDDHNSVFLTNGYYSMYSKYIYRPEVTGDTDVDAIGFVGITKLHGKAYLWRVLINSNNELTEEETELATEEEISDLKEDLSYLKYVDATITDGRYASYIDLKISTISDAKCAIFDVSNVSKIFYKYTLPTSVPLDNRGLYFEDKNGVKSGGVQTSHAMQEIIVPADAIKCYITISSISDIVCYDIYGSLNAFSTKIDSIEEDVTDVKSVIIGEQPVEILASNSKYTNKTSGGITYTWSEDRHSLSIVGTRTGTSFNSLGGSASSMAFGMVAGESYDVKFNPTNKNITLSFMPYINGTEQPVIRITDNDTLTLDSDLTGLEVRIIVIGSGTVCDETVDRPQIFTIPKVKGFSERITKLETEVYGSEENPLAHIIKDGGLLSCFTHVGCIGDSLSSGECAYHKADGSIGYRDVYVHSWGQYLARMTGNTYYNFSNGGLTTKTWLESNWCTQAFDGNHDCTAYFIGLGQNDKNVSMTVGTLTDIDLSNYNNNADTYYGNYGKIIQKIQEHSPKAKIFCFIDPYPPSDAQQYNEAIRVIETLFSNVYLIDLDLFAKDKYRGGLIGSQLRGGHYSAIAYKEMAYYIATYVDWIIRHNASDFAQIEFINTDYEW